MPTLTHAEQSQDAGQFLRRAISGRRVFVVAQETGLARAPSRHLRGRDVALLWSEAQAAARWVAVQPGHARVKEVEIEELLIDLLPALTRHQRLVGLDWTGAASEPELEPRDLAGKLRLEMIESFLARIIMFGAVWTLGDAEGPALLTSATLPGGLVMPCWSDERQAGQRLEGPWRDLVTMRIRLADFLDRTLPDLSRQGRLVAPEHVLGPGALELEAGDLAHRIGARRVTEFV